MSILNKIQKAVQQSKIVRYKTYKKIGCVGYRKNVDQIVLGLMISMLIIGAFYIVRPDSDKIELFDPINCAPNCPIEPVLNQDAQEVVHSDLGDDPVIEETEEIDETIENIVSDEKDNASTEEQYDSYLKNLEERVLEQTAKVKTLTINKGETLAKLLARANLAKKNQNGILNAFKESFPDLNLNKIQSETPILIFLDKKSDSFIGIIVPNTKGKFFIVHKENESTFSATQEDGFIETQNRHIKGVIERTFSGSAQKYGVPKEAVNQIIDALDGEMNLRNGVRKGDVFEVIYTESVTSGGMPLDLNNQVLFVALKQGKKAYYRYLYTDKTGTSAFYNPLGQSGQKTLAKRPVKAVPRLSSSYGWRMHPILMYRIFHSGVDLACPKGTPIYAAADGRITQIGRKGAYGKYIRMKHAGGYETAYAHMNGYKSGLKKGSYVKQGNIIGYVGSTGRSTGPHLHFEVWKNGKKTNPFNTNVIAGKQLTGFELEQFQSFADSIHPEFQKHLFGKYPPIPPVKPQKKTK